MSYIHPENQTILWNVFRTIPYYREMPEYHQTHHFRQLIAHFYEEKGYQIATDWNQLLEWNKQTLERACKNSAFLLAETTDKIDEYEKKPKELNFLLEKDEPIQNVEELLKQQEKEREELLNDKTI
jgi:hypothetical protein